MSKVYTYKTLIKLDKCKKNSEEFASAVRLILKDFMFKNLLEETSVFCKNIPNQGNKKHINHVNNIKKIRHSIINYLYSGEFTLDQNPTEYNYSAVALENIKANFKNYDKPDKFFNGIELSWKEILPAYTDYLKALETVPDGAISKIIVYEAPPYNDPEAKKYCLKSKKSNYFKAILKCFNPTSKSNPIDFLVENYLGFFDISIACLPLSKGDIRKSWNTKEAFRIGNKQITVVLFELSFEHFINFIGIDKIAEHPLFAIGTPVNSSAGIFEYYSCNLLKVYKHNSNRDLKFEPTSDYQRRISIDLSITNSTTTYKKRNAPGETFPLYKSNIINSGYPSYILMKNAFNMETD